MISLRWPHAWPHPARRVEIFGELGDWWSPREVGPEGLRVEAPAGVYAYKFRVDGAWAIDPSNPRTRSSGGHRNNVACVSGAPEPILFAPAAPFVIEADRGGLVVIAALRRGHGASLVVHADEGGRTSRTPMERAQEEDEHVVFRARIAASSARVAIAFECEDGAIVAHDEQGRALVYARARAGSPGEGAPAWWRSARVYTIFVDRFRAAEDAAWGRDPGKDGAAGGHLDGIRRSLDELHEIGIDALYLTPVHVGASAHRYDVIDPMRVDPALGGEEAFARLVSACHARGMRLVLDFSFSHAGRGFPAYEEVRRLGRASRYASWFQWTEAGELRCYGKRSDAPLFALDAPELRALVIEAATAWARRGIDGLRLDSAAEFPLDLAREVRARLRAIRPEAVVVGEVVPAHAWRWRAAGAVDAATDFAFHGVLQDLFARRAIDVPEALSRLDAAEIARGGPASSALRFASTHDHVRLATLARATGNADMVPLALMMLTTWPGVPALLYGEEVGLVADVAHLEPEDAWPDRMPMRWRDDQRDLAMRALLRSLLRARATSAALSEGELDVLHVERDLLVYRRAAGEDVIDVALNLGDGAMTLELDDSERPRMEPVARAGSVDVAGARVMLGARSGVVVRRGREESSGRAVAIRHNVRARDACFAGGITDGSAWPTRIDLAITERCNLRCQHCITLAPERTATGSARTLSPWLLDRVREAFAYASYFGFVHGGESLTAPIFWDVLAAIAAARGSEPYVVHLLTNGVLLGASTTLRLIDAGVRSIAVSLDGARAETNDAVRIGGRFDAIVHNLRGAVRLRREVGADLRLGISLVVMRSNVDELADFVDLAASCGVDWIKLEEVAPVTPYAARSLVRMDDARVKDAVRACVARAESRGLVAVDHTTPIDIWRCQLDARAARFLAADELANRSTIHPCRVPWEHVCIEPNGEMKLGDFFAPSLGSIARASFGDVWRGAIARSAREDAPRARLCGRGPVRCVTT